MKEHIQSYLDWKAGHTTKTAQNYRPILERFARIVQKGVGELTVEDITKFQYLNKLKYASTTCRYQSIAVRDFIKYCCRRGWTNVEPDLIRIPKADEYDPVVLAPEEFEDICLACNESSFEGLTRLLVFHLLWSTGVRVSELCDLDVDDLSLEERVASIRTKKSRKMGLVMWDEETHKLLLRYLGTRLSLNRKPALILNERRRRVSPKSIQRWVRSACEEVGISKQITPHSFRHGKAHWVVNHGGGVREVQVILRHSEANPLASFRYIRASRVEFKRVASRFFQKVIHSRVHT